MYEGSLAPDREVLHGPLALYTDPAGSDVGAGVQMLTAAGFRVEVHDLDSEQELVELAAELQPAALLVSYLAVGERVFAAAPSIQIVSCSAVGFDCVDLEAANAAGVWVANVPDAATEEVASHALAMALALVRHLPLLDRHVREGGWHYAATGTPGRLSEMTLAVIGMGRIGRRLANMGSAVFGQVIGFDAVAADGSWPAGIRRVGLDECLAEGDVVSLHLPLNDLTRSIIDEDALARMRPGSFIVNVSRGGLIDTGALLGALDTGRLGGAALDVTDPEPPDAGDRFRRHPQILITPHAAFLSAQALKAYVLRQAENVIGWHRNGRPNTPVNDLEIGVV